MGYFNFCWTKIFTHHLCDLLDQQNHDHLDQDKLYDIFFKVSKQPMKSSESVKFIFLSFMEAWYKFGKYLSVRQLRDQCPSIPHLWPFGGFFSKPLPFSNCFISLVFLFLVERCDIPF